MLHEVEAVGQAAGGPRRRLFTGDAMELYLFEDATGAPASFQLAYERGGGHAVLEYRGGRLYHAELDTGPADLTSYDRSGVLRTSDAPPDLGALAARFDAASGALPGEVRRFVASALAASPETSGPGRSMAGGDP